MTSTLEQIVLQYPNQQWNFDLLSRNPNISQAFMDEHHELPWNIEYRYENPNIDEHYIQEHNDGTIAWNYEILSTFKHLSIHFIESHIHENWDFFMLSAHPNVDILLLLRYPEKSWNYEYFCKENPNTSYKLYKQHPNFPWKKQFLCENQQFTWEEAQLLEVEKCAYYFSNNPNITLSIIKKHPDLLWNWQGISRKVYLDEELFKDNIDCPWNYYWLSENPYLTWSMVLENDDKEWELEYIYLHLPLNKTALEHLKRHFYILNPNITHHMSLNRNTPLYLIEKYNSLFHDECFGHTKHIDLCYIMKHYETLDHNIFNDLSYNYFHWKDDEPEFLLMQYYKTQKIKAIQKTYILFEDLIKTTWHPSRFMAWCLDYEEQAEFAEDDPEP
jgi:hypothetical protein